jgi:FtsZ-interacting cell division protein ZipA
VFVVKKVARYQGGSIVSFIIISVLIVAVLAVGLFVLRQRGSQVASEPAGQVATNEAATKDAAKDDSKSESSKDSANDSSTSASGGSTIAKPDDTSAAQHEAGAGSTTGPEQLLAIPVLGVLTYVVALYVSSRKTLRVVRARL